MASPFKQDSQILADLGSRIRDLRLSHGYSQVELSKKAAVGYVTIQSLEKSGRISLTSLLRILRVLGEHHVIETIAPTQDFDPQTVFEEERENDKNKSVRRRVTRRGSKP